MDNQRRLIQFLSEEYSGDYWSDIAIDEAINLAEKLSVEEWRDIYGTWRNFDRSTQIRLAEIVSEVSTWNDLFFILLCEMLASEDEDVIEVSIDSLNSIAQTDLDRIVDPQTIRALLAGKNLRSPLMRPVADSLLARIG